MSSILLFCRASLQLSVLLILTMHVPRVMYQHATQTQSTSGYASPCPQENHAVRTLRDAQRMLLPFAMPTYSGHAREPTIPSARHPPLTKSATNPRVRHCCATQRHIMCGSAPPCVGHLRPTVMVPSAGRKMMGPVGSGTVQKNSQHRRCKVSLVSVQCPQGR